VFVAKSKLVIWYTVYVLVVSNNFVGYYSLEDFRYSGQ